MMPKFKNKTILLASAAILSLGLAYQNCGQVKEPGSSAELSKKTNIAALSNSARNNIVILSLQDGTKIKMKTPDDQPRAFVVTLQDGTRIKVGQR